MFDPAAKIATSLASRSSRRQVLKFLSATSLGTGLFLTGTGIPIVDADTLCAFGCGMGPCPVCSGAPPCAASGCGACFSGCPCSSTQTNEWYCCDSSNCQIRCSECCVNGVACSVLNLRTGVTCGGGTGCPC